MNFTNTQLKTANTQLIKLSRVNSTFHKKVICFSVIDMMPLFVELAVYSVAHVPPLVCWKACLINYWRMLQSSKLAGRLFMTSKWSLLYWGQGHGNLKHKKVCPIDNCRTFDPESSNLAGRLIMTSRRPFMILRTSGQMSRLNVA